MKQEMMRWKWHRHTNTKENAFTVHYSQGASGIPWNFSAEIVALV